MQKIDMQSWLRRKHFDLYQSFDHPHWGMCANLDLTNFIPSVKQRDLSITAAIVYVLARVANSIPEFRQRIRADEVVIHDVVHPSITVLLENELFSFCLIEYSEGFAEFAIRASERIAHAQSSPTLDDGPEADALLFMTAIPWVSFTSFTHPMHLKPVDSIPRFAWGKFFQEGERLKMPLGVQAHHALIDGIHAGKFYTQAQDFFQHPERFLESG